MNTATKPNTDLDPLNYHQILYFLICKDNWTMLHTSPPQYFTENTISYSIDALEPRYV